MDVTPFLIAILILFTAVLTLMESAMTHARPSRLEEAAREGRRAARSALKLMKSPHQLLSAARLTLLLVAVLVGALGEMSLAEPVSKFVARYLPPGEWTKQLGMILVVFGVTAMIVLVGDLLPRRFGALYAEPIVAFLARPMRVLGLVASPFTAFLDTIAELILRMFGLKSSFETLVTQDEIRVLIEQGAKAGVFEKAEQDIMTNVFRLGDRRASSLMTPRTEMVWLRVDDSDEEVRRTISASPHSHYPVGQENLDNLVGVLSAKDCLARSILGQPVVVEQLMRKPLIVPEGISTLQLLEAFRESPQQMALIADEYGSILGMVSQNDVLEALVGDLPSPEEPGEMPLAIRRDDGSWLIDASMSADEFKDLMGLRQMPGESDYDTLGGFVLMQLQRIPKTADWFMWNQLRFEIVDMDGKRIDKVLVVNSETAEVESD